MIHKIRCFFLHCNNHYSPDDDPVIQEAHLISQRIDRFIAVDRYRQSIATPMISRQVRRGMEGPNGDRTNL